jgi:signal peptidase I
MGPKTSTLLTGHTSVWRTAAWVVPTALLILLFAALWPANLGGRTTYVSTHGTSMLPRFHTGDLAIVRPASDYRVGMVAAYKSETLHGAVVLHRIVAIDHGRFSFKGDNNNFTDPDHPKADAIVGKLRARIPHGGAFRMMVSRPIFLFPFVALIIFAAFFMPRGKNGKKARGGKAPAGGPRLGIDSPMAIPAALAVTAALVIAGTVWLAPGSQSTKTAHEFCQTAKVGYSATAQPGAAYSDGRVHTGDPVFTKMIPAVTFDLNYAFTTPQGLVHEVRGTSQIVAQVSTAANWQREIPLTAVRTFGGDKLHRTATLDLGALRAIQLAFTAETGLDASTASVRVVGKVHLDGTAEGTPIAGDLAPKVDFTLTPVELIPKLPSDGTAAAGLSVTKTGSVVQAIPRPRTFGLGPVRIPNGPARLLTLLLLAAVLAGCIVAFSLDRERPTKDAAARIVARYRHLLVTADAIPALHRRPVVRVDSMRDLARLAKLHDELVVHADESGVHRFALFTDPVAYLFEMGTAREAAPQTDMANWALAGLEALALKRRHQAQRTPLRRHPRPTDANIAASTGPQRNTTSSTSSATQGSSSIGAGATADSTR